MADGLRESHGSVRKLLPALRQGQGTTAATNWLQISPSKMVDAVDSQWFIEDVEPRLDTSFIPSQ